MVKLGNFLILIGIFLIVYAILGTCVGSNPYVLSYIRPIKPSTLVAIANSCLILGAIAKLTKKA